MRLQQHLTEKSTEFNESQLDVINEKIHKECKTYLKLIKNGTGKPMYRGMYTNDIGLGKKDVRKDRRPYGMSRNEADCLNKWLQKNGHARRDKSIMMTSNKYHVELFGSGVYFVFPMDKMRYTWIKTKDINLDDILINWMGNSTVDIFCKLQAGDKVNPYSLDAYNKLTIPFEKMFVTNKDWQKASSNGYETWVESKAYYFADANLYHWNEKKQELFL